MIRAMNNHVACRDLGKLKELLFKLLGVTSACYHFYYEELNDQFALENNDRD